MVGVGVPYPLMIPTGTFVISDGVGLGPGDGSADGLGIQLGTLQHWGSLGSATIVHVFGT